MTLLRVACATCAVEFAPDLTQGACPVCGTSVGEDVKADEDRRDGRIVGIAIAAMVANLLLLGWLATLYLGS